MDYRIIPYNLPSGVKGCIVKQDDFCTILVNARLTYEEQKDAARHELTHLRLGHLDDHETPVAEKEKECARLTADARGSLINQE